MNLAASKTQSKFSGQKKSSHMSRLYLEAGAVLEKIIFKKVGIKNAVYGSKCSAKQKPSILGLVSKALANQTLLHKALTSIGAFETEEKMRRGLLLVMTTELLLGSGEIRGGGHVKRFLVERLYALKEFSKSSGIKVVDTARTESDLPRYIRVNPSRWKSVGAAIAHIKASGVAEVKKDEHIPNLLVIDAKDTKSLVLLDSIKTGALIMQDKSTCVSAHALLADRPKGLSAPIHVVDACSAPGGKTIHILEMLRPGDSLTAVELNPKRAKILEERLAALGDMTKGVKVKVVTSDFLKLFQEDFETPVTHINLDPSCSGSGMPGPSTKGSERLKTLSAFQSKMLKHALHAFDTVKTVCYSTCSVMAVENQDVVNDNIMESRFRIETKPLPAWWTEACDDGFIRTTPAENKCRGFFLAKLVRVD